LTISPLENFEDTNFLPLEVALKEAADWLAFPGIYRFRDPEGAFLYIGESNHIPRRLGEHRADHKKKGKKPYAAEDADVTVDVCFCPCDDLRLRAETLQILRHNPRHNKAIKIGISKQGRVYPLNWR